MLSLWIRVSFVILDMLSQECEVRNILGLGASDFLKLSNVSHDIYSILGSNYLR